MGSAAAAGRRQFDGEGQAVEAGADVGDERQQVVGHFQGCARRRGRGPRTAGRRRRRTAGVPPTRSRPVTRSASRLVATSRRRGQRRSSSSAMAAAASMRCSQLSSTIDQLAITDHVGEPGGVGNVERRRDRRGHRGGITDGRKLDDVATIGKRRPIRRAPPPAPAASSPLPRAHEGQKSMLRGEAGELAQLVVASDERRERFRDRSSPLDFGGAWRGRRGASSVGSWARIAASRRRSSGPGSSPSSSARMWRPFWKTRQRVGLPAAR